MAIKPRDNEAFYREVDEELRREQMASVWKRYGWLIVAAIVLLLAAIAGAIYWKNRQAELAAQRGETLMQLLQDIEAGRVQGAPEKLEALAKEGGEGYRAAALLTKADMYLGMNQEKQAVETFGRVAADGDLAKPYRELALIRQTTLQFDSLPPAEIVQRMKPLAVAGSPWLGSAGELLGLAYLKQNQPNLAAPVFAAMAKDEGVPPSLRSRATQIAGVLGVDAIEDSAATGQVDAAAKEKSE